MCVWFIDQMMSDEIFLPVLKKKKKVELCFKLQIKFLFSWCKLTGPGAKVVNHFHYFKILHFVSTIIYFSVQKRFFKKYLFSINAVYILQHRNRTKSWNYLEVTINNHENISRNGKHLNLVKVSCTYKGQSLKSSQRTNRNIQGLFTNVSDMYLEFVSLYSFP